MGRKYQCGKNLTIRSSGIEPTWNDWRKAATLRACVKIRKNGNNQVRKRPPLLLRRRGSGFFRHALSRELADFLSHLFRNQRRSATVLFDAGTTPHYIAQS